MELEDNSRHVSTVHRLHRYTCTSFIDTKPRLPPQNDTLPPRISEVQERIKKNWLESIQRENCIDKIQPDVRVCGVSQEQCMKGEWLTKHVIIMYMYVLQYQVHLQTTWRSTSTCLRSRRRPSRLLTLAAWRREDGGGRATASPSPNSQSSFPFAIATTSCTPSSTTSFRFFSTSAEILGFSSLNRWGRRIQFIFPLDQEDQYTHMYIHTRIYPFF